MLIEDAITTSTTAAFANDKESFNSCERGASSFIPKKTNLALTKKCSSRWKKILGIGIKRRKEPKGLSLMKLTHSIK